MIYSDFVTLVREYMTDYSTIQGIQTWIDKMILAGFVDLQSAIPYLQGDHEDSYEADDLVVDGYAHRGSLPTGQVVSMRIERGTGDEVEYVAPDAVGWDNYPAMKAGVVGVTPRYAIHPNGREFVLTPKLVDGETLVVEWEGVKRSFESSDTVDVGDEVAHAVSEYALARVILRVDHDAQEASVYANSYSILKRKLYSDYLTRTRPAKVKPMLLPSTYSSLITGESTEAPTVAELDFEAVANSSGNVTIAPDVGIKLHRVRATITGSAGTRVFVLDADNRAVGDVVELTFVLPDTADIVLELRNDLSDGTLIYNYTTKADEASNGYRLKMVAVFDGSAWQPESSNYPVV